MARPIRSITLGLAWRLFLAQAFTVLFAVVALILTWGDKDSWGMDMFVAEAVAKAVHSEGGRLVLDQARWDALDTDAGGNLWFAAVDDKGVWLERGTIPAVHAPLLARLPTVGASELGSLVPPYLDVARVMIRNEDGRRITVMVGGAPKGGLLDGALMVLRLIGLWFFLPLIVVTLLVMPTVIHRAMRGVRRSAQQAKELDIGQPGARLDARLVSTEVAPLVEAFNDAIDKVQQGYAARDKFLADAAHELRVPIAVVQARLSQLPQGELKSQLLTDVARLGNVAEHLLDLQRLDRNVGALQRLDLAQLVREAAADLAPLVVGAGYGFEVDAPDAPVWIHGDSLALGRVIAPSAQRDRAWWWPWHHLRAVGHARRAGSQRPGRGHSSRRPRGDLRAVPSPARGGQRQWPGPAPGQGNRAAPRWLGQRRRGAGGRCEFPGQFPSRKRSALMRLRGKSR